MPRSYPVKMQKHAIGRMYERYGLVLSYPEYFALCAEIANRQNSFIATGYQGRLFYRMRFRGITTLALWDPAYACIVTFVPRLPAYTATERAA
jgi:hypothetical protein